ncbi:MAG: insulinase family protein, partial [Deltaproteobacteria bacterium]|nr:insulinase family protein [Deltaproteobacteria bacterium]
AHLMLKEPLDEAQERLDRMRKRVQLQAQERFAKELYPNHVYGTSQTEPKVLAGVSFSSMDTFVRSHFRPDRALGIIIGNVDEARVRPMIETYFSRWQGGGGTASNPAPPAPRDRRAIIVFDRPGATQSSFSFGCRLPDLTAESFPAHALVGHIVGEDLRAVREEWGATYALYATLQTYPSTVASLVAGGAVETARTAEAIKRLLDNLADIATNGPAIKPFTLKRWDMAIEWNNTVTSNEGRAGLVIAAEKYGLGTQMWDNYGENLANTSRQQVADLVKSCTGKEVVVVVGDRTILEPAFTALGLAITE